MPKGKGYPKGKMMMDEKDMPMKKGKGKKGKKGKR